MSKEPGDPRVFDVRHIDRNMKRGLLSRKEYDKFLKSLPDVKDKAAPMGDMASPESDALDDAEE